MTKGHELMEGLSKLVEGMSQFRLMMYDPYPWQKEIHKESEIYQERLVSAANRVGKTFLGAAEVAMHATGLYPPWWQGYRMTGPGLYWIAAQGTEQLRDVTQRELTGGLQKEEWGTGAIPKFALGKPSKRMSNVNDVIDRVEVTFYKNGNLKTPHKKKSIVQFKSYEQGWEKFQGTAPDFIWLDEEPPYKIFTECQTRLATKQGRMLVTFTPLSGHTDMIQHFSEDKPGTKMYMAGWDDAPHLNKKWCKEQIERYPPYERDARTKGVPQLGSGRVFTLAEEDIVCEPFEIPIHFAQLIAIDFGHDHPAATVKIAWDRDSDVIYVVDAHKQSGMRPLDHCEHIKRMGGSIDKGAIAVAWPHDGINREKGSGKKLYAYYLEHGALMLRRSARYEEKVGGAQPSEPIIMELLERMQSGRFKVFSHLIEWFKEFRSYHRDDNGRLVARNDDILKATFYAVMDKRYASTRQRPKRKAPPRAMSMR